MSFALRLSLIVTIFLVPLFPAFITLTGVSVPGVSLLPAALCLALLGLMGLLALLGVWEVARMPNLAIPSFIPLAAWMGAILLALVTGFNPSAGALFIAIFGATLVWHLAIMHYYAAPGMARQMFLSYLLSGALASLVAILTVLLRAPAPLYTIGHGRAIGTFILPGELAGYLIIYLPVAFALARVANDRFVRVLAYAGLALGAIALLMTFSRAGWVGFAAGAAFYVFVTRSAGRMRSAIAVLGTAAVALAFFFNFRHNPSENFSRLSIWQSALSIIARFPLTGVGPFDFAKLYPLVRLPDGEATAFHAHSFLLTAAAETGVIGVAATLFAWGRFIVVLRERLRRATPTARALSLAIAAGLLGTWVQGLIDTVSVVIFGLWLPFMALALASAASGLGEP